MSISDQNRPDEVMCVEGLNCWFSSKKRGENHVVKDFSLSIPNNTVTAFIGRSGSGKSTVLRCLNRMNETIPGFRHVGKITLNGEDIYAPLMEPESLRARVGIVFQKPNPFPKSIHENIAYGARIHGFATSKQEQDTIVEDSLKRVGLWDEVKNRLGEMGTTLSGGQQQRLCIARAIAINPEVLLMDEPCSSLDPEATATTEQLIQELRDKYAVVIVTHNMQQARRISDKIVFMDEGELVESGDTSTIVLLPKTDRLRSYLSEGV